MKPYFIQRAGWAMETAQPATLQVRSEKSSVKYDSDVAGSAGPLLRACSGAAPDHSCEDCQPVLHVGLLYCCHNGHQFHQPSSCDQHGPRHRCPRSMQPLTAYTAAQFNITKTLVGSAPFLVVGIYNGNSAYRFEVETVYFTELPSAATSYATSTPSTTASPGSCDALPIDQASTSTCQIRASDGQTVSTLFTVGQRG